MSVASPPRLAGAVARLRWAAFAAALALASLFASWHALAAFDFGYPVWHELLGIDRTIERYGPENRFRRGFERTTPAERARLFAAIVDAIHDDGRGLAELRYHAPDGRALDRLLRPPEIRHLRDVARLVTWFGWSGWGALAVVAAIVLHARRRGEALPPLRRFAAGACAALGLAGVLLVAVGPVTVFYWLHERIFPVDHPWFFWYQESLMSTMMQAPDLFGVIAAVWVVLALALAAATLAGLRRCLPARDGGTR